MVLDIVLQIWRANTLLILSATLLSYHPRAIPDDALLSAAGVTGIA